MGKTTASWFSRKTANHTDAIIAPTEKVRRLLLDYRVNTPVSVIPIGIEFEHCSPIPKLRSQLEIPKKARALLFLGRLAEEKNISALSYYARLDNTVAYCG